MLQTIPFKRSKPRAHKKKRSHTIALGSVAVGKKKSRVFNNPWTIGIIILGITTLGILIIRYSRASEGPVNIIPQNLVDIQNYVNTLQIVGQDKKDISGNAVFRYTPRTDKAVKLVGYYIDGKMYKTSKQKPYEVTFNTNYLQNGEHQLTVVAFSNDDVPISAKSQKIIVTNNKNILQTGENIITYPWYWILNL